MHKVGKNGEGYANLPRIYTVWVVFNPRDDKRNCIRSFTMKDDSGKSFGDYGIPDLLNIVMIYLPNPEDDVDEDSFLAFVAELFAKHKASEASKWKSLIDRAEVSKLMGEMNTLSYQIFENGIEKGMVRGRTEGVYSMLDGTIKTLKECQFSENEIAEKLVKNYKISVADAKRYVKQYY